MTLKNFCFSENNLPLNSCILGHTMPKKPPKGAFFFFLMDFKRRCEQNGERFPDGLKNEDLKDNASREWQVG